MNYSEIFNFDNFKFDEFYGYRTWVKNPIYETANKNDWLGDVCYLINEYLAKNYHFGFNNKNAVKVTLKTGDEFIPGVSTVYIGQFDGIMTIGKSILTDLFDRQNSIKLL